MSPTASLPSILAALRPSAIFTVCVVVERAQMIGVVAVLGVHRPQERRGGNLPDWSMRTARVSFLVTFDLDPAAALGDDAAAVQPAVAAASHLDDEVHARASGGAG